MRESLGVARAFCRRYKAVLTGVFIAALLAYVFLRIDREELRHTLSALSVGSMAAATCLIATSQIVSALRMRLYVEASGPRMGFREAVGLYFASMFLNVFMPGGIGGDGYKCVELSARYDFPPYRSLAIALSERASGLLALLFLALASFAFSRAPEAIGVGPGLTACALVIAGAAVASAYRLGTGALLREKISLSLRAFPYSLAVQLLQFSAMLLLLAGLPDANLDRWADYGLIFFLSSLLAMVPVSVGGLGVREATFFQAAEYLDGISPAAGAVAASAFFLCHLPPALCGVWRWGKKWLPE
ncbi:MAG: lysylphosphatidylglycerol synthase transmembrane domain-containing protein [Rickettsiales bacterium]